MKLQLTHLLIFLGVAYSIIAFIIYISLSISKKFTISSREDLEKFIDLKDSVIKNLKPVLRDCEGSEIVNLKPVLSDSEGSQIANLEFERNALSQKLEEIESL